MATLSVRSRRDHVADRRRTTPKAKRSSGVSPSKNATFWLPCCPRSAKRHPPSCGFCWRFRSPKS